MNSPGILDPPLGGNPIFATGWDSLGEFMAMTVSLEDLKLFFAALDWTIAIYPLVNIQKTMENHHFSWENSLFLWQFSIAMLNYQRVCIFNIISLYMSIYMFVMFVG